MKVLFIASPPRAGSTWFSNLFNSHPDVAYRHEPLGRLKEFLQTPMFLRLKTAHGLAPGERNELLEILLNADPETARPPFFDKSFTVIHPKLLHCLWGAAVGLGWGKGLFAKLNTPESGGPLTLVVKETGWSMHLRSIMAGLLPDHTIFLLRHPCAIISSIKDGVSKGLMRVQGIEEKTSWYESHKDLPYVLSQNLSKADICGYSDLEFWATKLRVLYELFLEIQEAGAGRVSLVVYEDVQAHTIAELEMIFPKIGLNMAPSVYAFIKESKTQGASRLLPESISDYFSVHRGRTFDPYRWRSKLSQEEINLIGGIVGTPILDQFWPESTPVAMSIM